MLGFIVGLGIAALLPLLLLAVVFDVFVLMFALGFKALKIGVRVVCAILSVFGVILTIPLILGIILLL